MTTTEATRAPLTFAQVAADLDALARGNWSSYDAAATAVILGLPEFRGVRYSRMNGRVLHVSASGMTRDLELFAAASDDDGPYTLDVAPSWSYTGRYKMTRGKMGGRTYRVTGCGMDMIFFTAETLFQRACRLLGYEYGAWSYLDHCHYTGGQHRNYRAGVQ
jgi:hypothetical protein